MNILDIIIAIPIIIITIGGFQKGLIKELASLAALILGIYFAIFFSDVVAAFLVEHFDIGHRYVFIVAFILTFIGVVIIVSLIGKFLHKVIKMAALGPLNRILGMVFGFIKGVLIVSILLMLFNMIDSNATILKEETRENSMLYGPVVSVAPLILLNLQNLDLDDPSWDDYKKRIDNAGLDKIV
nr:CvpA family protein [Bacteroidota bacterium]